MSVPSRIRKIVVVLTLCGFLGFYAGDSGAAGQTTRADDTITMAFYAAPGKSPIFKFAEVIYREAFRRLGFKFAYIVMPMKRCSAMADRGEVDGEPGRIRTYGQAYPNLIRVNEPILTFNFSAYATDAGIKIDGWESLAGADYRIEYLRGTYLAETRLANLVPRENVSVTDAPVHSLKMLQAGRIDLFLHTDLLTLPLLNSEQFSGSGIVQAGIMESFDSYHYLHQRHAALAVQLAVVLKQLKEEGLHAQYLQKYVKEAAD